MCNLNILIKKKKGGLDSANFLNTITTVSYANNSDGDGIYLEKQEILVKSKQKLNILALQEQINDNELIISHQRLATHGKTEEYVQPFESERFVFVHNGILYSFVEGEASDSFNFFKKFQEEFVKVGKVVKAVKNLLNGVGGSYSIAIYDKLKRELYYFKNSGTNINFCLNKEKDLLFITTADLNEKILNIYLETESEFISSQTIYKIDLNKKKIKIEEVGKIKPQEFKEEIIEWVPVKKEKQTLISKLGKDKEIRILTDKERLTELRNILECGRTHEYCMNCGRGYRELGKWNNLIPLTDDVFCDECLLEFEDELLDFHEQMNEEEIYHYNRGFEK